MSRSRCSRASMRQDLGLRGHVERRRRLVRDQQLGIASQRQGDNTALQHAAGQLVRIAPDGRAGSVMLPSRAARRRACARSRRPLPWCQRTASAICAPTVKVGSRLIIGCLRDVADPAALGRPPVPRAGTAGSDPGHRAGPGRPCAARRTAAGRSAPARSPSCRSRTRRARRAFRPADDEAQVVNDQPAARRSRNATQRCSTASRTSSGRRRRAARARRPRRRDRGGAPESKLTGQTRTRSRCP